MIILLFYVNGRFVTEWKSEQVPRVGDGVEINKEAFVVETCTWAQVGTEKQPVVGLHLKRDL
jgi:hypothetical protein